MQVLLLSILLLSTESFGFPLYSWIPSGASQVSFCWPPVVSATSYELYKSNSFSQEYHFAEAVADTALTQPRSSTSGREYFYLVAFNEQDQMIERSDTVGCYYLYDVNAPPGTSKVISFALGKLEFRDNLDECQFAPVISTQPSDIIGVQISEGAFTLADRVVRQDGGYSAYRSLPNGAWVGTLEAGALMLLGRAYFFSTIQNTPTPVITGCARSDYSPVGSLAIQGGNSRVSTPLGFPVLDDHHVSCMGLETCGFRRGTFTTSDLVIEQRTGRTAHLMHDGNWRGTLDYCSPEAAYFIINRPHDNGTWLYNFQSVGLP